MENIYVLDGVKCCSSKQTNLKNIQRELAKAGVKIRLTKMSDSRKAIGSSDKFWGKDQESIKQRSRFLSKDKLESEDWDLIRDVLQTFSNVTLIVPFFEQATESVKTDAIRGFWYTDKVIFVELGEYTKWVSPTLDSNGNIVKDGYYTWDPNKCNINRLYDFNSFIGRKVFFEEPEKYSELRSYNDYCDFEVNNLARPSSIDLFENEKLASWDLTKKNIVDGVDVGYNVVIEDGKGKGQNGLFKKRSVETDDVQHNDIELLTLKWLKEHDALDVYESLNVGRCPACNHKTRMSVAGKCNFCGYTFTAKDLLAAGVEDATAYVSPEALSTDRHEVYSTETIGFKFTEDDAELDVDPTLDYDKEDESEDELPNIK